MRLRHDLALDLFASSRDWLFVPRQGASFCVVVLLVLGLAACALAPRDEPANRAAPPAATPRQTIATQAQPSRRTETASGTAQTAPAAAPKLVEVYPPRSALALAAAPATGRSDSTAPGRGDITLNFENADVRVIIDTILSDLLSSNFVIDPDVRGVVTLKTDRPISRQALIPTLEAVLAGTGAVLLKVGEIYRIATAQQAGRAVGPTMLGANATEPGFALIVVPLEFVSAASMQRILTPLLPEGRIAIIDEARNIVVVRASGAEQKLVRDTVAIFDVDQLAGTTVLLEALERVDVATVIGELENIFGSGKGGPLAGVVRFIPVERLNAILVMTQQPRYIEEVRNWIARLDRSQSVAGRQLFVYYVQNGKAADLARTLNGIFSGDGRQPSVSGVAPLSGGANREASGSPAAGSAAPAATSNQAQPTSPTTNPGDIRIIADEVNNALLIRADRAEYSIIQDALAKLDIVPLQVLIEASIIEVTLRDVLRFGVQYFFNSGGLSLADGGKTILTTASTLPIQPLLPGFSFTLTNGPGPKFILDTLTLLTEVNVLSSPQVLVLDNQTARIQVGDQVPITTQFQQSTVLAGSPLVNTVEYRDTGVHLNVRPRVNASGLVTLELVQEVSDVVATTTSTINSPTIQQRKIVSTVAVNSGETVVLGGLIREINNQDKSGIPGLVNLPLIGPLFGSQSRDTRRTELLVLLTPRVVRNQQEARDLTRDISRRFAAVLELRETGAAQPRRFSR
ncbi:MAG: type II secretion system protein GspD [Alphaproteobacteria bacterium]|nr:type II secretion system protein GspD [Alphaproteobacteria bacterium]